MCCGRPYALRCIAVPCGAAASSVNVLAKCDYATVLTYIGLCYMTYMPLRYRPIVAYVMMSGTNFVASTTRPIKLDKLG